MRTSLEDGQRTLMKPLTVVCKWQAEIFNTLSRCQVVYSSYRISLPILV